MKKYDKPSPIYYIAATFIFILALVIGFIGGLSDPTANQMLVKNYLGTFQNIQELPSQYLFIFIFLNNTIKAFISMIVGMFFGVLTISFLYINALFIGMVMALAVQFLGFKFFLAATLPHGIIELVGIITASALGLWLGVRTIRLIFYKEKEGFISALKYSLKKFVIFVIPILLIAALIEAFVTPLVIRYLIK